ncbi:MAG: sugar transferase [Actinomycetota bacterium]
MSRRVSSLLLYSGIVAIVLAMSAVHANVFATFRYDVIGSQRFPWTATYIAFLGLAAYVVGLPDVPRRARQIAAASVAAPILAVLGVSLIALALGEPFLPRFVVVSTTVLAAAWFATTATIANGGRSRASGRERVVLIGDQDGRHGIEQELRHNPERPATIVAQLTVEQAQPSPDQPAPIREVVEAEGATLIVLDRAAQSSQAIVDQAAMAHEDGVRVRTLSLFYEQWLGKLPISELERVSLLFDIGEVHRQRYSRLKRVIDLGVAVALLPLLLALVPIVAIGNALANRGPLLFHQDRVGKGGTVFRIHKFRTMRPDGDGFGAWTAESDMRVTPFGAILRRTHLDELPQLINIVRGELSLVGPRPEQPAYVAQLEAKLPYYQLRHLVQPGLTGWAQVKFGYARSEHDALEKLQFEFYYLRRQALAVDLRILVRTMRTILPIGGPSWH